MIAGKTASPAAGAVDDFNNTRRLTGAVFIVLPPGVFFLCHQILWPFSLGLFANGGPNRSLIQGRETIVTQRPPRGSDVRNRRAQAAAADQPRRLDRKSTRLNSSQT